MTLLKASTPQFQPLVVHSSPFTSCPNVPPAPRSPDGWMSVTSFKLVEDADARVGKAVTTPKLPPSDHRCGQSWTRTVRLGVSKQCSCSEHHFFSLSFELVSTWKSVDKLLVSHYLSVHFPYYSERCDLNWTWKYLMNLIAFKFLKLFKHYGVKLSWRKVFVQLFYISNYCFKLQVLLLNSLYY